MDDEPFWQSLIGSPGTLHATGNIYYSSLYYHLQFRLNCRLIWNFLESFLAAMMSTVRLDSWKQGEVDEKVVVTCWPCALKSDTSMLSSHSQFKNSARRYTSPAPCSEIDILAFYCFPLDGHPSHCAAGMDRTDSFCTVNSPDPANRHRLSPQDSVCVCCEKLRWLSPNALCLDGEALPRSLVTRLDHSLSASASSASSLLCTNFDEMIRARATGNGRLAQATCNLISRDKKCCGQKEVVSARS